MTELAELADMTELATMAGWHALAYCAAGLMLLTWGGNLACRGLFRLTGLTGPGIGAGTATGRGADTGTASPAGEAAPDMEPEADTRTGPETDAPARPAGWIIGALERLILAIGILTHSWEVMAAVIALKTVSRFRDLDDRSFAEYFLVGSLFSLFWAFLVTSGWLAYDHHMGLDLRAAVEGMVAMPDRP